MLKSPFKYLKYKSIIILIKNKEVQEITYKEYMNKDDYTIEDVFKFSKDIISFSKTNKKYNHLKDLKFTMYMSQYNGKGNITLRPSIFRITINTFENIFLKDEYDSKNEYTYEELKQKILSVNLNESLDSSI